MEVNDLRPILAPMVSFLCAGLVFAFGQSVFWRRLFTFLAAFIKMALVLSMLPGTLQGVVYVYTFVEFTPGIGIGFRADAYGMFFSLVSSTLWLLTTIYAIGYMQGNRDRVRFFGFFALCVSTTVGVAFAENLLTLFLFYETLTLCTYPLVVHRETREALRAGRIYLTYTLIGGGFALVGAVMVHAAVGTLTLAEPGILSGDLSTGVLGLIFVSLIIGFGVKAGIMPLHGWLPVAMVAPTPVSALLHAVAVVKVGAFGVTRVIYNVFGVDLLQEIGFADPLAYLAAFTILASSTIALSQDHLKRRLAYSTISQLSYIILGAALLTPLAATAAVVHVANQAFAKITMFFVVGAITRTTGKKYVSEIDGIAARMPVSMAAFAIAALSFVGVPLTAGFITKWYLALGALEAEAWWFVLVLVVSSLLNAGYFFPILYRAYFKPALGLWPPREQGRRFEAPKTLLIPMVVCALYVVLLGLTAEVPGMPFSVAQVAVEGFFVVGTP